MNAQAHTAETIAQLNEGGQYHTAAALALKTCRATLSIRRGSGKPSPFRAGMNHYRFTIETSRGSYSGDFWQSVTASAKGEPPTQYDILACLQWRTDEDNAVDFADSYGYTNGKEAERAFRACKRQSAGLARILSPEQIEILSAIY